MHQSTWDPAMSLRLDDSRNRDLSLTVSLVPYQVNALCILYLELISWAIAMPLMKAFSHCYQCCPSLQQPEVSIAPESGTSGCDPDAWLNGPILYKWCSLHKDVGHYRYQSSSSPCSRTLKITPYFQRAGKWDPSRKIEDFTFRRRYLCHVWLRSPAVHFDSEHKVPTRARISISCLG